MTGHDDDLSDDERAAQQEIAALCARHRALLAAAGNFLVQHYLSDLRFLEFSWDTPYYDFTLTMMSSALPKRGLPADARLVARKCAVGVAVVAWKLTQAAPPPPACLAEDLACRELLAVAYDFAGGRPRIRASLLRLARRLLGARVPPLPGDLPAGWDPGASAPAWFEPYEPGRPGTVHPFYAAGLPDRW
jgi:hypothetical protein